MNLTESRRIAFLLPSLKFGGGERVALNLAAALRERGYVIDIVVMQAVGELLDEARRDFAVVDLACARTWELPWRLAGYLRRAKPSALISSFWKLNLCACLARIAAPRTRLALWEHSPPSRSRNSPVWLYGPSASLFYRLATRIVAVSGAVAQDVSAITMGLGNRIAVIHNAIPAPIAPAHEPVGRRIVWVGRLDDPKNPGLVLEAFALLPREGEYSLRIVGDGPLRKALEARAMALGIADQVEFTGFQPDVYAQMAEAGMLVLSSDREGLGNVLIEALYAGLRIVSTDCSGGVHEVLPDEALGTIVPAGDAPAMATAIAARFSAPHDAASQRRSARRFEPSSIAGSFLLALGLLDSMKGR